MVRLFNENIFGNPKFDKILAKKPHRPGHHGQRYIRKRSDYALQLTEKQKLRAYYGVLERQFRRYYNRARKLKAATGAKLLEILESRLDNIIYRAGLAPTRAAARQLVGHGHVLVDGKKIDVPSYEVKPGAVVSLTDKGQKVPHVAELLSDKDFSPPKLIKRKAAVAKVERLPQREEVDANIQEQQIVEFYSR